MATPNVQFNGPVGQTIIGGKIGRIDTRIVMGEDGEMTVISTITNLDDNKED